MIFSWEPACSSVKLRDISGKFLVIYVGLLYLFVEILIISYFQNIYFSI